MAYKIGKLISVDMWHCYIPYNSRPYKDFMYTVKKGEDLVLKDIVEQGYYIFLPLIPLLEGRVNIRVLKWKRHWDLPSINKGYIQIYE